MCTVLLPRARRRGTRGRVSSWRTEAVAEGLAQLTGSGRTPTGTLQNLAQPLHADGALVILDEAEAAHLPVSFAK